MNQCVTQYKEDNAYKLQKAHRESNKDVTDQKVVKCFGRQYTDNLPLPQ